MYNSQQLSASAGEKCPATIKLVLMLGSLQCSRQFFREIYGSIIHCCDEKVKIARHGAPAPHHEGPEHANAAKAPAVSEGRIRETAKDWWNTHRLEPSHAVHAFGNCRTPCHDFSQAACCPVLLPCLSQLPCPVTHVSLISFISFAGITVLWHVGLTSSSVAGTLGSGVVFAECWVLPTPSAPAFHGDDQRGSSLDRNAHYTTRLTARG